MPSALYKMTELEKARETVSRIDREMVALFEARMRAVREIAACKKENGLPVKDEVRERELLAANRQNLTEPSLGEYYDAFQRKVTDLSCAYQETLIAPRDTLRIRVEEPCRDYPVYVRRGGLSLAKKLLCLPHRVLVLTDEGVPEAYVRTLFAQLPGAVLLTVPTGEKSKSEKTLFEILSVLSREGFTRSDGLVCLGGGVVGDLGGLAASLYLRGIPFYQIPTTLLSQVDSSVGGKTAIDFDGTKNTVGAFCSPKGVLADTELLSTLDREQIRSGIAEMIKIAAVLDEELFSEMEKSDLLTDYGRFISACIALKAEIVKKDPKEQGLRRVLNFGHTVGHAAEALHGGEYLHGFCVAMGMPCMAEEEARERIVALLSKAGLPIAPTGEKKALLELIGKDKKAMSEGICTVVCKRIGTFEFATMTPEQIGERF